MILAEDGGPWKLVVVLVILTALGYALTPVLQRYWGGAETGNRGRAAARHARQHRGVRRARRGAVGDDRLEPHAARLERRDRPARALLSLELRSARSLSLGERAELFTAAYEGYLMPMHVDEAALGVDAGEVRLRPRCVADRLRDDEPVGLGNLGVRGRDAWIGGVGVVATARRAGVGEALMRAVHEEARREGSSGSGSR